MGLYEDSLTGVVAAGALSASLALRVLKSVLEVAARKQDSARLRELVAAAGETSERLVDFASEDGAAYASYMQARKQRSPELQMALRKAIETPLNAARAAAGAIELCREAADYCRGAIAADVAGAAVLLAGAAKAILCSVDANLRAVEDGDLARALAAERGRLEGLATAAADKTLTAVKTASNSKTR